MQHSSDEIRTISGVNSTNLALVEAESLTGDSHLKSFQTALSMCWKA